MNKIILAFLCVFGSLSAEVQQLVIKWNPVLCKQKCVQGLSDQFYNIKGVAAVEINQAAGQAQIRWKPEFPISFPPINTAMSMIGAAIEDIRVKVRGTIGHDVRTVSLISLGDNTRFLLLGSIMPQQSHFVTEFSPYNRPLDPQMRQKLLDAQANDLVATIEGPLFQPERSPPNPLMLIVENVRFEKPK